MTQKVTKNQISQNGPKKVYLGQFWAINTIFALKLPQEASKKAKIEISKIQVFLRLPPLEAKIAISSGL